MVFIFFVGGVVVGITITTILHKCNKTYGIIEVDHVSEACKVRITSHDFLDRNIKKAIFDIDHNAVFSREEQTL